MRGCLQPKGPLHLQLCGSRSLRTLSRRRPRHPVVKQLSNAELLALVKKTKEDVAATPSVQPEARDPEAQDDDARSRCLASSTLSLPLSPLLDPHLVAARNRHREGKPRPSGDKSPFQLKLQKNPYGIHSSCLRPRNKLTFRSPSSVHSAPDLPCHKRSSPYLLPDPFWFSNASNNRSAMAPSKSHNRAVVKP
jgi:hypothetical protein